MIERGLYHRIWSELSQTKRMIFLAGPRQTGKTTFARAIADTFPNRIYFNWDVLANKKILIEKPTFFEEINRKDASTPLVVFDELHKYRRWKNYLKGVYDQFAADYKFFVLGSGRLDVFQKGGDSLAGRYSLFYLWPFTLGELGNRNVPFDQFVKNPLNVVHDSSLVRQWEQLSMTSGFPEPFAGGKETEYRRWSRGYHRQLIREDIRQLTEIKNIDDVEILFSLLPSKIGAPLSVDSVARDLQVSFNSVKNWLNVFESLFLTFRISPWSKKISRAILKEKKLYLYDYAAISDAHAKFENMVALELLRAISNWNDLGLGDFELHYIRNKEKEETDFLIADRRKPFLLVETKLSEEEIPKSLRTFQNVLRVPAVHLVNKKGLYKIVSNGEQKILVATAADWLATLP